MLACLFGMHYTLLLFITFLFMNDRLGIALYYREFIYLFEMLPLKMRIKEETTKW